MDDLDAPLQLELLTERREQSNAAKLGRRLDEVFCLGGELDSGTVCSDSSYFSCEKNLSSTETSRFDVHLLEKGGEVGNDSLIPY